MTPPPMIDSGPPPKKANTALWLTLGLAGCGVLVCGGGAIALAVFFPVFAQAREAARTQICANNLRQSSRALTMYAADHDDHLPPAESWMDALAARGVRERSLHCPAARDANRAAFGYALNAEIAKKPTTSVKDPVGTALVFDSTATGRNAVSDLSSLPAPGRHTKSGKGNNVAFVDGHTDFVKAGSQ